MPQAFTGGTSPKAQEPLSMLWINCWAVWSPESQLKWYQFWYWYSISLHSGCRADDVG